MPIMTLASIVKRFVPNRLSHKLILSLTVLIVVAEGIAGYLSQKSHEEQILEAMINGGDQLSRSISSATWHAMLEDHRESAYQIMQSIAQQEGIDRIRIFNKEGRVMFSTITDDQLQVDKRAEACYLCHASNQPLVRVDVPSRARVVWGRDGHRKLALITPIYNEPSCSEAECHAHPRSTTVLGVLDVSLDLTRVDANLAEVQNSIFLTTAIHVVLVGVLIVVFTRKFVDRPIQELIAGTRSVSEMRLEEPIRVHTGGEMGELAHSFDIMRERLRVALGEINAFTQTLETKVEQRTDELKAAQKRLLQSDRLASLGQLSASVAHEINNPLSGVLNLSMLLQRIVGEQGIPPHRVEEVRRYLTQISDETGRVGHIVADLLAFSRRSAPRRVDADLKNLIGLMMSIIGHKLKLMNVRIDLDLVEEVPPVLCDPTQIQQVLINLVMNAAEASQGKPDGRIVIRSSLDRERGRVVLCVDDNGDGIPAENLDKIFDPFFTTKGEGKGVGLGLAVVYGIVEAHGGEIQVRSTVGIGTTITVSLPASQDVHPSVPEVPADERA